MIKKFCTFVLCGLAAAAVMWSGSAAVLAAEVQKAPEIAGLTFDHSMELSYAEEFSVDYYDGGYALITVMEDGQFLVVPEGKKAPKGLDKNITVIQKPVNNIYLVATSAMNLFCALDSLDHISLSGTDAEG